MKEGAWIVIYGRYHMDSGRQDSKHESIEKALMRAKEIVEADHDVSCLSLHSWDFSSYITAWVEQEGQIRHLMVGEEFTVPVIRWFLSRPEERFEGGQNE